MPTPTSRRTAHTAPRALGLAVLIVAAAVLLAGWASTGAGTPTSASRDPAVQYAQCLRSHGLRSFPDPSPGQPPTIPPGVDTQAPAFRAAQRACVHLLPSERDSGSQAATRNAQLLQVARCMRANGVPTFADPTSAPPPSSDGNALGVPGAWLSLGTAHEQQSPAYKHAAAVCGSPTPGSPTS
jgi:hypothetical protein